MRDAEERTWEVVRRAYEERSATRPARTPWQRTLGARVAVTLVAAAVLAVFSQPGRAVFKRVQEAVGVEHAAPALFSLPSSGRLLVSSRGLMRTIEGTIDQVDDRLVTGRRTSGAEIQCVFSPSPRDNR